MKHYYLSGKQITEAEAKEIEANNQEILRDGTIEELLKVRHVTIKEVFDMEQRDQNWYPLCCDCQYCGDKFSFPLPNDMIYMDAENPAIKHFYCCCGDCPLYAEDVTGLGIKKCEHFEEL